MSENQEEEPRLRKVVSAADGLSLGISMVVAVLFGVGLGLLMQNLFDTPWLLWLGVFWGVAAAILNVYKVYKKQKKSLDELANDPKYRHRKYDDSDEDDKY
ncbi:MAG: ATP synthase protein I-like membrane protein [uncultured Sulfurovum sp.]|uniref:ATP synthase protein I-like membrane protein n=1 Tax=uncultured Sulfurovum sp. TaxID=269237 RepID=A0A6S6TQE5_9BACT|nr:MAG: ATP synthase protein I-like membrane protein [uncultured Sulfurovum sp.]